MTGFNSKRQMAADKNNRKRGSIALARSLCYQINGAADDSDDMDGGGYGSVDIAEILSAEIERLLDKLAQPAQEPVAHVSGTYGGRFTYEPLNRAIILPVGMALYAAPQREWVGLTDEEIHGTAGYNETRETYQFALALIAKLKERNS